MRTRVTRSSEAIRGRSAGRPGKVRLFYCARLLSSMPTARPPCPRWFDQEHQRRAPRENPKSSPAEDDPEEQRDDRHDDDDGDGVEPEPRAHHLADGHLP